MGCAGSSHVEKRSYNRAVEPLDSKDHENNNCNVEISLEPQMRDAPVFSESFEVSRTYISDDYELRVFKYKELRKATHNFKDEFILGEGGFGRVYKGWLRTKRSSSPMPVAIKKLHEESIQGQQEWLAEIFTLGRLRHGNLVKLFGYCAECGQGLLVYEYLAMGSLDYHLFPEDEHHNPIPSTLSFKKRIKIALEMANGLSYLHEYNVIHRDFKTPNVLLDEKLNPKLTDFGLAKIVDTTASAASTVVMGTLGYLDPRYFETGRLNFKSDVFAFGVMLLELLTGRRAVDKTTGEPLTAWSKQFLFSRRPDMDTLVDQTLKSQLDSQVALKVAVKLAVTAKFCIEEKSNARPTMKDVADTLASLVESLGELGGGEDEDYVDDHELVHGH